MYSGMWRCVDPGLTDVSEDRIAPIFRIEKSASGSPLVDFSTLQMEAIRSSETSVNPGSIQHHIPDDDILHSHHCENLKSYIMHIL
jgi:hypothetical protein